MAMEPPINLRDPNVDHADQYTALHAAVWKGQSGTAEVPFNRESTMDKVDGNRWSQKDVGEKHENEGTFQIWSKDGSRRRFIEHVRNMKMKVHFRSCQEMEVEGDSLAM